MTMNELEPLANKPCPCRAREEKPLSLARCCGPYLAGTRAAPTAQALMRSRYSAYALGGQFALWTPTMLQYLQNTWHPDTLPSDLALEPMQWTGLKVLASQEQGDEGSVKFIAFYKEGGKTERLEELSQFLRINHSWLYTRACEDAH